MTTDPDTDAHTARYALVAALQATTADTARLRALVLDVVTAAFQGPAPEWMTDDLWARLTAETPKPADYARTPSPAAASLFELEAAP